MDAFYKKTMRQAVTKGVKALDKVYGRTVWVKKIQLKRFKIDSSCDCVLGQVMGPTSFERVPNTSSFYDAAGIVTQNIYDTEHGFDYAWRYENGAKMRDTNDETQPDAAYAMLQKMWLKAIRQRKGLKAVQHG